MDAIIIAVKLLHYFITLLFLKALNIKLILNATIWNQVESYNIDLLHINIFGVSEFQSRTETGKYNLLTDIHN